MDQPGFTASLVAGGVAGVSVDLILFPLDTIKTRLQSPQGFNKAGGFRGIYAGVPSTAIGSFPNAAAFFITYEYVKWFLHSDSSSYLMPVKHMLAASAGEVVACLIRVPSEVVKQRAQVSASSGTFRIFSTILYQEGIQGLYRGYKSTVLREAGGVAGVSVDLILFPLDTIKTRLQSPQGFNKAGGFRGIYAGVPSTAIGSFPNAAAFFITYEYVKWFLHSDSSSYLMPVKHMLAASAGEVVACLIRVPSEVVKQRAQVSASSGTFRIFSTILYQEGIQGLYRGYKSTVLREIPFSLVQFPLWESLKALWSWRQDHVVDSWQSAVCGAFAGGFAAAVTTPLDVAKTRIMLAKAGSSTATGNVLSALHGVWRMQGLSGLFAGVLPRMAAISLGGFIFLGAYDRTRSFVLELGRERP